MSSVPEPLSLSGPAGALYWRPMTEDDLPAVLAIEKASYGHPWSRGNFADSLTTGFYMPVVLQERQVLGYLVAMEGVEEAHLLNITVAAGHRGTGLGRLLMQLLEVWAVAKAGARQIWLEVRESNEAAAGLYCRLGYRQVALRKNYYPLSLHQREHARVMCKWLEGPGDTRVRASDTGGPLK